MKISKAVITAGGWGTRFLPVTKAQPKELLPLVDKPLIQYAVEEAVACGLKEIIIVINPGKEAIQRYFEPSPELEQALKEKGKEGLLAQVKNISAMADFHFVLQEEPLGLGHAVMMAEEAVGDEPFALFLPDDIIEGKPSAMEQMLAIYERHGSSVVAVERVPREAISSYGIVDAREVEQRLYEVLGLVEKPHPDEAPSDLGIVGRYILMPQIFQALKNTEPGALGELQITDGMATLLKSQPVYAYEFQGKRHDVGNPLGFLKASIELALKREDMGPPLREFLESL
ncbi:MAG: UTP--glucose-1-phosphate uridylyltransferase GalU [Dehalococcoidia bacterium]